MAQPGVRVSYKIIDPAVYSRGETKGSFKPQLTITHIGAVLGLLNSPGNALGDVDPFLNARVTTNKC